MGETGCGKTRLIRYMCDLAAQGGRVHSAVEKRNNMLIMKVCCKMSYDYTNY